MNVNEIELSAADQAADEVDGSLVAHVDAEDGRDAGEHPELHGHQHRGVGDRDRRGADPGRGDARCSGDRPRLIGLQPDHYTLGVYERPSHRLGEDVIGPLHELLQSPGRNGLPRQQTLPGERANRRPRDRQALLCDDGLERSGALIVDALREDENDRHLVREGPDDLDVVVLDARLAGVDAVPGDMDDVVRRSLA